MNGRVILFLILFVTLGAVNGTVEGAGSTPPPGNQGATSGVGSSSLGASPQLGSEETLIFDGRKMPTGWSQASDPSVVQIGNQWWMFFTSIHSAGFQEKLATAAAYLPAGRDLGASASEWKLLEMNGQLLPVVAPGASPTDWDHDAVESPDFVRGYNASARAWVNRIYYTGWKKVKGAPQGYKIGCAEWRDEANAYVKCPSNPLAAGTHPWEKLLIGDQSVYYEPGPGAGGEGGLWHLWYNANSSTSVVIGHATSSDGLSWRAENRHAMPHSGPDPCGPTPSGPYHLDVTLIGGNYLFAGWAPSRNAERQGLWLAFSRTPDGGLNTDFKTWYPLIYESSGAVWHKNVGPFGAACPPHSTGLFAGTIVAEGDSVWLFYHGVRKESGVNFASIGRARIQQLPSPITH